ncbi:MAG: Sua5/YciO/YrdC/YwlC family protein [Candidatus Peribacteria bacterium]|nr:MAG: Sua5/YciO/YrdC/YwlC family protein [Candidatus Peribacteria bacterium]
MLAHPFQKLVQQIGQPVITTSVNYTGQTPISHPDEIENPDKLIDIVLDAGKAPNQKSSLLVHYTTKELIER